MRRRSRWLLLLTILCTLLQPAFVAAGDTISPRDSIKDGSSLVSSDGRFCLGFFSLGSAKFRYLGIWYNTIPGPPVIWVANRNRPLPDSSGVLSISGNGTLVLSDGKGQVYWSTGEAGVDSPIARLLNNANFVVIAHNGAPGSYAWQSFDYPTDSLLPGMKLRWDRRTGRNSKITAWRSTDDPALGDYAMGFDGDALQIFLLSGTTPVWRVGPWNGHRFPGIPEIMTTNFSSRYVRSTDEVYFLFDTVSSSLLSRIVVQPTGVVQHLVWIDSTEGTGAWRVLWFAPKDQCDTLNPCGPFGVCDISISPVCGCLPGFEPRSRQNGDLMDGCLRRTEVDCRNGTDGFVLLAGAKLPDTSVAIVDEMSDLDDCRGACLRICSCTAYANTREGGGCILWGGSLTDLRLYKNGGQDLFVRLAAADLVFQSAIHKKRPTAKAVVAVPVVAVLGILILLGCIRRYTVYRWKKTTRRVWLGTSGSIKGHRKEKSSRVDDLELPLYDFSAIAAATHDFRAENKLGEGGFGPVYLGRLAGGQEVAVKRLAKNSAQGLDELKNEVMLIAKLQHRNLVRLLGCCIQGEERMLIYEYMPNKSLDAFLFDETKGPLLDWKKRHQIINGVARGLLYLHQDSRFRIIHRDLKAGNVLLDKDMNPKISDFGLARICGGDETGANTRRVVGTYGYMSPEYIMEGVFSVKSDVFSFGVVVLEIVSGKRNRGLFLSNPNLNLLGYAWSLWKAGKVLELVDSSMAYSLPVAEVLKCIQVGLLCVQERPVDRPTMASVVHMLGSDTAPLPQPKQPGFMATRSPFELSSSRGGKLGSVNDATVTTVEGR